MKPFKKTIDELLPAAQLNETDQLETSQRKSIKKDEEYARREEISRPASREKAEASRVKEELERLQIEFLQESSQVFPESTPSPDQLNRLGSSSSSYGMFGLSSSTRSSNSPLTPAHESYAKLGHR